MIMINDPEKSLYNQELSIPFSFVRPTLCRALLSAFRDDVKLSDTEYEQWELNRVIESLEKLEADL